MGMIKNSRLAAGMRFLKVFKAGKSMSRDLYILFHYGDARPFAQAASCESDKNILTPNLIFVN